MQVSQPLHQKELLMTTSRFSLIALSLAATLATGCSGLPASSAIPPRGEAPFDPHAEQQTVVERAAVQVEATRQQPHAGEFPLEATPIGGDVLEPAPGRLAAPTAMPVAGERA